MLASSLDGTSRILSNRNPSAASTDLAESPSAEGAVRAGSGSREAPEVASAWAVAVATVTGNVYLVFGSALMGLLAAIASWVPGRDWAGAVARLWARGLLVSSGVRLRCRYAGGDLAAWRAASGGGPVVYMANHRSLYDIAALLAILDSPVRFLAKRSLFRLPFFGWGLKAAGFVPVDRHDRSRAGETFAVAGKLLGSGVSLAVFPEETRSSGPRMRPFQRGGFLLALKGKAPVAPIGIRGTGRIRRKGALTVRPATVDLGFGEVIDPRRVGVRGRRSFMLDVERRVGRLAGLETAGETDV